MIEHRIDHPHNEASAMIAIHHERLLRAFGWELGFWIASDEARAHKCLAALGRRRASPNEPGDAWEVKRLKTKRTKNSSRKKTDDAEAMARVGPWIYVFGSQFGSKSGPLQAKRHWIARFNEHSVEVHAEKGVLKVRLEVARPAFLLHRAVNDALIAHAVDLLPQGARVREDYLDATLRQGEDDAKSWRRRIVPGDRPINVEGVAFLPNGRLVLGLRYPVTDAGHPILVEIDGLDQIFLKTDDPQVRGNRVWVLSSVGSRKKPVGIRALDQRGRTLHAITGDLDSDPDDSRVLADHPEGLDALNEHHVFEIPVKGTEIRTRRVRQFDRGDNVEGLCLLHDQGSLWYVHDADDIRLHECPLEEEADEGDTG